jgi:hypothetical protein
MTVLRVDHFDATIDGLGIGSLGPVYVVIPVGQLTFSVDSGLQMPRIFFMDVYTLYYTCTYE